MLTAIIWISVALIIAILVGWYVIKRLAKEYYIRFIFYLANGQITGPWIKYDSEKIDTIFGVYGEMNGNNGIDHFQITDKNGHDIILPPAIAKKMITKIETKMRLF